MLESRAAAGYSQSGQVLYEARRGDGVSEYIYLGGRLLATRRAAGVTWMHVDALGSPVAVTDGSGSVVERRRFEPYGAELGGQVKDGPGYTGHVSDAATGLSYMQQRYYDPSVGAFLSVDPVTAYSNGDMRFFNRYAYAFNNPYRFSDPDGRQSRDLEYEYKLSGATPPSSNATFADAIDKIAKFINPFMPAAECYRDGCGKGGWAMAGISAIPAVGPEARVLRGGSEIVRIGQRGEQAVRAVVDIGPKVGIKVNGVSRIPDGLTATAFNEVKNVASLSFTSQLRDFAQYAKDIGRQVNLFVRSDTKLSAPHHGCS